MGFSPNYGDSRIRVPYKDRWKRDLLRVKDSNLDCCITGEIDVLGLHQVRPVTARQPKTSSSSRTGSTRIWRNSARYYPKGGQA